MHCAENRCITGCGRSDVLEVCIGITESRSRTKETTRQNGKRQRIATVAEARWVIRRDEEDAASVQKTSTDVMHRRMECSLQGSCILVYFVECYLD